MASDNKQFTRQLEYNGGATAVGFDGSSRALTSAGTIGQIGPVFESAQCRDTLIPTGVIDGTDAQWVADAGNLYMTSGITFNQRSDGMYERSEDGRPDLSAKVGVRAGPGELYQMGNLLSTNTRTVNEQTIAINTTHPQQRQHDNNNWMTTAMYLPSMNSEDHTRNFPTGSQ